MLLLMTVMLEFKLFHFRNLRTKKKHIEFEIRLSLTYKAVGLSPASIFQNLGLEK